MYIYTHIHIYVYTLTVYIYCNYVTHLDWQNKSAHRTADDVDTGAPHRARTSGPPPPRTPCSDIRVE